MSLSATRFHEQFEIFKSVVEAEDGSPFDSFQRGIAHQWESYKPLIYVEGRRRLDFTKWKRADIGSGHILDAVISAIEINEGKILRNNLVQWQAKYGPQSRAHSRLLDARENRSERQRCEAVLFALYRGAEDIAVTFGQLVEVAGRRYDLLAYLFFLRDWERFMPIATSFFDEAFERLGLDARMTRQCSWENYESYVAALYEVRDALHGEGISTARLVDAHSFCFMLIRLPAARAGRPERVRITMKDVASASASPQPPSEPSSDVLPAEVVDFTALAERRAYIGRLAEERAIEGEKQRLTRAGYPELAARVRDVSQTHSLGYDIASFETDGSPRHIEVKAVSGRGDAVRFYLTENERQRSVTLPNYWFYLVHQAENHRPHIRQMRANILPSDALAPIVYRVSVRFDSWKE